MGVWRKHSARDVPGDAHGLETGAPPCAWPPLPVPRRPPLLRCGSSSSAQGTREAASTHRLPATAATGLRRVPRRPLFTGTTETCCWRWGCCLGRWLPRRWSGARGACSWGDGLSDLANTQRGRPERQPTPGNTGNNPPNRFPKKKNNRQSLWRPVAAVATLCVLASGLRPEHPSRDVPPESCTVRESGAT
jgi:hypothetical protein